MEGKKILITGASGLIGFDLARELCKANEVFGLARFGDAAIKRELESLGVTCIAKDVLTDDLNDLPQEIDYVFSQLVLIRECEQEPEAAYNINSYFVGELMQRYRDAKGIILGSTGAVYKPSTEASGEDGTIGPVGTYATSKFAGEVLGSFLSRLWSIPTCILRYYYPYSPRGGLPHALAEHVAEGKPIAVGKEKFSYYDPIHMFDCVRLTIQSAELCSVPPKVLNLAGPDVTTRVEMVELISQALGLTPNLIEQQVVEEPAWRADISLLKELLSKPSVSLKDGLTEIVQAIKKART
ncbi:NAD(P)-dependent oxidoreductase [Gammaproteobacteria bacterium]|nr:NAD(P)-dependent oxidoreductase [Gammaproteobacteria bacterium]